MNVQAVLKYRWFLIGGLVYAVAIAFTAIGFVMGWLPFNSESLVERPPTRQITLPTQAAIAVVPTSTPTEVPPTATATFVSPRSTATPEPTVTEPAAPSSPPTITPQSVPIGPPTITSIATTAVEQTSPTAEPTAVETATTAPSATPEATSTPAATATSAATATAAATATQRATATPAATATPQPTSTPLPTATSLPTATAVPPVAADVSAFRLSNPPTIDGQLADWTNASTTASRYQVFSRSGWDGSADIQADWQVGWDASYLYVAVQVTDDRHYQPYTGRFAFRGDSIELQLDLNRSGDFGQYLSYDDFQIILSPGDFGSRAPEAYRFRGNDIGQMVDATGHQIAVAAVQTADGYHLEARIPWSDLGTTAQANMIVGAALNANDNDFGALSGQEVMISNVQNRAYADPTTWGTMVLAP